MSWLYSQALVAAYSAGICSDGEQSALLSGNPIPQAYCAHDKMTAFSRLSRFGMTFKPLTDTLGEELLTLYRADFRAKTLVPQDAGLESPGKNPACGNTWRESLGRYDHATHSWKTAQCSLFEDSTLSSPTLPRWGLMRTGELFRRQTLVRPTDATESGLWPTPLASNTKAHHMRSGGRPARSYLIPTPTASPDAPNHGSNSHGPHNLLEVAQTGWKPGMMWPTPTSTLGTNGGLVTPSKGREGGTLIEALSARTMWLTPTVEDAGRAGSADAWRQYEQTGKTAGARLRNQVAGRQWPTPTCQDANKATKKWRDNHQNNLTAAVFNVDKVFPTPTARDHKGGYRTESLIRKDGKNRAMDALPNAVLDGKGAETANGQLNPTWVEWLMGWPLGWTDLKPLEMDKFQQWLQQHGVY